MGMPARKLEYEEPLVEERIARLEVKVEHIQEDVSELKIDIRRLDAKFDSLKDLVTNLALSMERRFSNLTVWMITLNTALGVGLLTVIARSFHWI
jgi:uncharacterized protein YlxW (UPF0749 family)